MLFISMTNLNKPLCTLYVLYQLCCIARTKWDLKIKCTQRLHEVGNEVFIDHATESVKLLRSIGLGMA